MTTINLALRATDAEPILREAAREAALYGAWCDYITRRTANSPMRQESNPIIAKQVWREKFLRAKRIVEAFGVEYEQTSEAETLGVYIPYKVLASHNVEIAGIRFRHVDKSEPDPKRSCPNYLREVHAEACRQAAARTVRKWLELTNGT